MVETRGLAPHAFAHHHGHSLFAVDDVDLQYTARTFSENAL